MKCLKSCSATRGAAPAAPKGRRRMPPSRPRPLRVTISASDPPTVTAADVTAVEGGRVFLRAAGSPAGGTYAWSLPQTPAAGCDLTNPSGAATAVYPIGPADGAGRGRRRRD